MTVRRNDKDLFLVRGPQALIANILRHRLRCSFSRIHDMMTRTIDCFPYDDFSLLIVSGKIRLRLPVPHLTGLENRLIKNFLKVLHGLLNRIHGVLFLPLSRIGIVQRKRFLQCFHIHQRRWDGWIET